MKKLLLFGLAIGMAFGGYSQKVFKSNKEFAKNNTERRTEVSFVKQSSDFQPNAVNLKSGNAVLLDRVEMGKSGNIYSVLTSYQRCLTYEETTGALLGTHRADPATYPDANASGSIMGHTSADGGATWNHVLALNPDPDVHALRYPSGVLYNGDGSTNLDDTYIVAAGPSHTGGTWDYTFYGAAQATGDNVTDFYYTWESENDWARSSMTIVPDAVYNFGQDYVTVGTLGGDQTMKQYVGTTDDPADGFEWEINSAMPDWLIDSEDGHSVALYTTWSAWSKDGSIGYMWIVGVSNDSYEYGVYQPQIMYSEDGGDSWDEIELDLEDHPVLVEFLPPWEDGAGNPGTVRPSFLTGDRTYPGVVDADGKLHLFSNVFGSSTGDVLNPDNGYWIVGDVAGGHIFDFVVDMDGIQDVIFVDSIMTSESAADAFGDTGWDHRLQASKSADETVIFAVWTDDADSDDGTVKNPDIKAWGYHTGYGTHTEAIDFTQDDLYAGFYFFPFVSEITPMEGTFYNIPVSTTLSPAEFGANDPLAPCTHTYVGGIGFDQSVFIGIEDGLVANSGSISVAQNNPNPFTGTTTIEVTSNTVAPVMVEVSNIMGQTVYTMNAGTINGTMKVQLNANDLESGVYFYTVRIGAESISKKMIVE